MFVAPGARPVGVVFQDLLLFPHLDAQANVAFGLRAAGHSRADADQRAMEWLDRMTLADRAGARPAQLSGGEAQRVALARALATEPAVLLLDEPLAALDARTRSEVRRDLRRHLAGFGGARIVVTHDPVDALVLGDRLVVIEAGRMVQAGSAEEIVARPRSDYVAELVGTNLCRGLGAGNEVRLEGAVLHVAASGLSGPVFATFHPRAVALHSREPEGTPRNVWRGVVAHVEAGPDRVRVQVRGPIPLVAEVTPAAVSALGLAEGVEVWAAVKATEVAVYPA
jgi:molybdate transport system ATP-binding protein